MEPAASFHMCPQGKKVHESANAELRNCKQLLASTSARKISALTWGCDVR